MVDGGFSVLITGANRGIGLGLVRAFLTRTDVSVLFAGARKPDEATNLKAINDARLRIVALDTTSDESISAAKEIVEKGVGEAGLNLLINNAGIFVPYPVDVPNRSKLLETLNVNTTSTLIMSQVFYPLLKQAGTQFSLREIGITRAAIVNITSDLGSISNCQGSKGWDALSYRLSKAALNQMTKTLSCDWKEDNIFLVGIHPGFVQSDMGGPNGALTIDESGQSIAKTIAALTAKDTGGYFDWTGKPMAF